jgi:hypothetical protein
MSKNVKNMHGKQLANVEEMLVVAKEVERVLGELGETLFEPLKEEHEEGMTINVALGKKSLPLMIFLRVFHLELQQFHLKLVVPMCAKFVNL